MTTMTRPVQLAKAAVAAVDMVSETIAHVRQVDLVVSWAIRSWVEGDAQVPGFDPDHPSRLLDTAEATRAHLVETFGQPITNKEA